jgi:uncharacterized membrane protein YjjP (DUF1212 family)
LFKGLLLTLKHRTFAELTNKKQMKKIHSRIQLSPNGKHWERWESTDRINWKITHGRMSLEEALKKQQAVLIQNHRNLLSDILRK